MTENNEESFKELRQIPIDKSEHKIRFLINGMKHTEIILREFLTMLKAEMKKLETLIPKEECTEFYKECFGFKETEPNIIRKAGQVIKETEPDIIRKAEQVIEDFSRKGDNDGK